MRRMGKLKYIVAGFNTDNAQVYNNSQQDK